MTALRIALVQADAGGDWSLRIMPTYLKVAADLKADVVVFPETFPFWRDKCLAPSTAEAHKALESVDCPPGVAFVAGGYVSFSDGLGNAVFHVHGGVVSYTYSKRTPWRGLGRDENSWPYLTIPGVDRSTIWSWPSGSCVPLIGADIYGSEDAAYGAHLDWVRRALQCAVPSKPDVFLVSARANYPSDGRWPSRLFEVAGKAQIPVVFCNAVGPAEQGFGGGGSAAYFPDGTTDPPTPPAGPGVFVVEVPKRNWGSPAEGWCWRPEFPNPQDQWAGAPKPPPRGNRELPPKRP